MPSVKRFVPFSNGSEALSWMSNNCDKCKYYKCHTKTVLEKSFITGDITLNRGRWIGMEDNQLKSRCEKHTYKTNRKSQVKNTSKQYDESFIYNMF
jgi:hypothetical protein